MPSVFLIKLYSSGSKQDSATHGASVIKFQVDDHTGAVELVPATRNEQVGFFQVFHTDGAIDSLAGFFDAINKGNIDLFNRLVKHKHFLQIRHRIIIQVGVNVTQYRAKIKIFQLLKQSIWCSEIDRCIELDGTTITGRRSVANIKPNIGKVRGGGVESRNRGFCFLAGRFQIRPILTGASIVPLATAKRTGHGGNL